MSHEGTKTRSYRVNPNVEAHSAAVVDAAFKIHKTLGPGLLESVYETCLAHELVLRGIKFSRQLSVPVIYDGIRIDEGFRLDFLIEEALVVEIKAVQNHNPLFEAQLLTYMRLANCRLGLLINFSVPLIKHGIKRFVL